MLSKPTRDQVIALAGIFQACQLVETLAKNGSVPSDRFNVCIDSLFQKNPESTDAVFGSVEHLQLGIESMQELITLQSRESRQTPCDMLSAWYTCQRNCVRIRRC